MLRLGLSCSSLIKPRLSSRPTMRKPTTPVILSFIICLQYYSQAVPVSSLPRVAIIGGGIGGASTAYYLRSLFGSELKMDLYEKDIIGGRLSLVKIGDYFYEAGGSIIHQRNRYMNEYLKKLNLERSSNPASRAGMFDGKKFVFEESRFPVFTYMELLWRYGLNLFRWNQLMSDMLGNFDRVYDLQDKGYAYRSVETFLKAIHREFFNMTQMTMEDYLIQRGFTDVFINEFGMAASRVNYGQSVKINGFVGAVSLAAAQPDLWSVRGGNYQLVQGALNLSHVNIIYKTAITVNLTPSGKFTVTSTQPDKLADEIGEESDAKSEETREYDLTIIAAPQTSDFPKISFTGFPKPIKPFPGSYHRTVATFVQGIMNAAHFGFTKPSDAVDEILTINPKLFFNSLSRNYPVNAGDSSNVPKVYKVFSSKVLSQEELDELFLERQVTKVISWLAYPQYNPPEKLGDFNLHHLLYYTSPIEWAGSAMEMSAIAGRNVALLAYNDWNDLIDKIDYSEYANPVKQEL